MRTEAEPIAEPIAPSMDVGNLNADKRRCVEIALREFPKLSSRGIAELCGVEHHLVDSVRPKALAESANATRTTKDGRQYPAHREPADPPQKPPEQEATAASSKRTGMDGKEDLTPPLIFRGLNVCDQCGAALPPTRQLSGMCARCDPPKPVPTSVRQRLKGKQEPWLRRKSRA